MKSPTLFRFTGSDLYYGPGRRLGSTMKLVATGGRSVARPDQVRGRIWKDIAGAGILLYSPEFPEQFYHAVVLTRRCVERFVVPADLVFDVDLSSLQSQSKSKQDWSNLDYVALVPHGGVDFAKKVCRYDKLQPNGESHYALPQTWDGTNYVRHRAQRVDVFCCSREILEIARAERWTGFEFQPADLPLGLQALWEGVDYLGEEWPPRRWYPPDPTTFTGVADWIGALDEVGDRAYGWVRLMMREIDEWASQDAMDWIASYITENEPGTRTVDYAARVYMYSAARHADRFRFDPAALERAHEINEQIRSLGLAALRKRYGK